MGSFKPYVVIPNWNGARDLPACLDSLLAQSLLPHIIVVENGSTDNSLELLQTKYSGVEVVALPKNRGFAGGVNAGIKKAMADGAEYIALFNNDAVAHKDWLKNLTAALEENPEAGIATCKFMSIDRKHLDSTGDIYTTWGLAYPRGRDEPVSDKYDGSVEVFGASGGASLYRSSLFEQIGLFDEDFFAYYEDVDLSFRAQIYGWKIIFVPQAIAYHQISATGGRIKGFSTYQSMKNYPLMLIKNVPAALMPTVLPRFTVAYLMFFVSALAHGKFFYALKGSLKSLILLPRKLRQRRTIQKDKKVSDNYIRSILTWDLPPHAVRLRRMRAKWWRILRKKNV